MYVMLVYTYVDYLDSQMSLEKRSQPPACFVFSVKSMLIT